ncbi:MAG: hypothetical protein A2Y03_02885 [Omnitrophica WOR_2 bacterium GWF2_38_59]|nr:MAG: hypothetical protein A2Y03_02885 [Omnitrophica WOR_2 bacterium GWF2_38_59]OGX48663.1 MAG: hypothetical protein A2243_09770 [Omnitrophica WOR_2 bacterium RIFOXYA2_FULL_38_17]OGX57219.1 MAG: hypothetical protein A2306_01825 [Omnitrophica WOR_2 bacterium RIFOXYB2_FULL_38_16]OGX59303.1 MAG: hypothetical protein A2447_10620 [Omnitrophica WOR_2 bacterium RIFOXYC2_FULL_38_12]
MNILDNLIAPLIITLISALTFCSIKYPNGYKRINYFLSGIILCGSFVSIVMTYVFMYNKIDGLDVSRCSSSITFLEQDFKGIQNDYFLIIKMFVISSISLVFLTFLKFLPQILKK